MSGIQARTAPPAPMSEREQHILKVLVNEYLQGGVPVGSRTVSRLPGIDISAASVRNVMGDLEGMGLLRSPHTSAGRVPTSRALRLFVDRLLELTPPDDETVAGLRALLDPSLSDGALAKLANTYLSGFTRMAGMVTVPRRDDRPMRHVEFLPLSDRRVLAVIIIDDDEVQNRIIPVERDYSKDELAEFARLLNEEFLGRPLGEVRARLKADLERARVDMSSSMKLMIDLAGKVFDDGEGRAREADDCMMVAGETNLMTHADLGDMHKLRDLFDAFQQKRDIYSLLERCAGADGVQIFIGRESGYDPLGDCSLITAPYETDGRALGVLAVIGPKRMAYADVISAVDVTSRLLGAALNRRG